MRLYDEEIVQKVSVSEADILDYYRKNYERFILDIIEVSTEEEVNGILQKIRAGESFEDFARTYPAGFQKKDGTQYVIERKSLGTAVDKAISSLKPGEISGVVRERGKYYLIKLIGREDAPVDEIDNFRNSIETILEKQKIQSRSDEYLARLHEEANIEINQELLSSIKVDKTNKEKWLNEKSTLVEVNEEILTAGKFTSFLRSSDQKAKEKVLKHWLDRKLVDQEALSRHYEINTDLKDMVHRYRNQVLKRTFEKKVIMPGINITEESMKEYYVNHQEDYARRARYRIKQITVETEAEAREALNSLQGGANFSWLAKIKSSDPYASAGGSVGWRTIDQLPGAVKEIINTLQPGDTSPVLEADSRFMIIRLQEKSDKSIEEFDKVRSLVHRTVFREKYNEIYREYIDELKAEARIDIDDAAVSSFEEIFRQ
jgi:parvulin-like peptidyl-prolyl isomerase